MKKRNVGVCVLLSFITCGIYYLIWFIKINNEVNELAHPEKKTSGIVAILLTIITCGIYGLVWANKMGKLLDVALTEHNLPAENRGTIYLVMQLFGLGFIGTAMMQSTLNKMAVE